MTIEAAPEVRIFLRKEGGVIPTYLRNIFTHRLRDIARASDVELNGFTLTTETREPVYNQDGSKTGRDRRITITLKSVSDELCHALISDLERFGYQPIQEPVASIHLFAEEGQGEQAAAG